MASVTHDGHSFSLDGRRVWIVSGTVHYARIPRDLWADRLLAARRLGLNCIETPVVWGLHEPNPGQIGFDADLDLGAFLALVGELGMHAIVRMGPYVGDGYDLGGLPSWLIPESGGRLRAAEPAYLKACSRFMSAVCDRVAPLQVTRGGPVLLVQNEHEWFCGDEALAAAYLGELRRYLREGGVDVPVINRNNLFHAVEKEIAAWSGFSQLHSIARQLREVAPQDPRLIIGLEVGAPDVWGEPPRSKKRPEDVVRAIAEVLAAGGQFNLAPVHAGTHIAHHAGRLDDAPSSFLTTSANSGAPVSEVGGATDVYHAIRPICLFASTFSNVFAHLDPDYRPIAVAPDAIAPAVTDARTGERAPGKRPAGTPGASVVHVAGSQGSVVFVFGDGWAVGKPQSCELMLPDGSTLGVPLGKNGVAWVVMNAHLHGRSTLDFCTFNAIARAGRVFVCAGPAGAEGLISINGSTIQVTAPSGKEPDFIEHEDVTIAVLNEAQVEQCWVDRQRVILNALGLDAAGAPIVRPRQKALVVDGRTGRWADADGASPPSKPRATLGDWSWASTAAYVEGSSERFATIDGPSSMESLGAPSGYGWIRLGIRAGAAKRAKVGLFESADRLAVYHDGAPLGVVGHGPGAAWAPVTLPLKKGDHVVTALIDNLGRLSEGSGLGEPKGLFGHVWEVAPFKAGAAKLESGEPIDPSVVMSPFIGLAPGEATSPERLTWRFTHRKKSPVMLILEWAPSPGVVVVNDEPVLAIVPGCMNRLVMSVEDVLKRGQNTIQLALVGDVASFDKRLRAAAHLFEGVSCLSEKAAWSFAKWETPPDGAFEPVAKTSMTGKARAAYAGRPAWWRAAFTISSTAVPLRLDASGLSKGVVMLNGRWLCRYFVSTADGAAVPPQSTYYLPEPWLKLGEDNELVIFDEHGATPEKVKLVHERR